MKLKYITAALTVAITLASCQKTDGEFDPNIDLNTVRIDATVGGAFTRSNPLEEGAASAVFKTGDVVMVSAEAQTAIGYTFNGTAWSAETGKFLKWETNAMTFNAYYPGGVNNASMTSFDVPTDQSTLTNIEQADYMTYTSPRPEAKAASVSLVLNRKMARVVISTSFNDQYASGYTVESITVNGNTTGYANGSTKIGNVTVGSYKQDDKFYALLSPTTADATATFLTITVKKTADATTETLTVKGIPALAAATSYAYTVVVGKNQAIIGDVTITDWTTGNALPDGETDAVTKTYLDATFATALADVVPNITLKDDNDGKGKYLDLADNAVMAAIKAVTELDVSGRSITSLKGIEQFTGLTDLICDDNLLTTLDVSKLTKLTRLNCSVNLLTTLDVSKLTNLMYLSCANNSLIALDVSKLPKLINLLCSKNSLTTLDISNQRNLLQLECHTNNLTTLDILMYPLDVINGRTIRCGNQKDNRELRLIMTLSMYEFRWKNSWKDLTFNNRVIPIDPSGTPH